MHHQLLVLLNHFIATGSDPISIACSNWLSGKIPRSQLELAMEECLSQIDHCDHLAIQQLNRALELLPSEPAGYYFEKLVRDRIPEMIRQQGSTPHTRVLHDDEYLSELYRKLREETEEFLSDETEEEIADILEVIDAICTAKGFSKDTILQIKDEKRSERGGFDHRLYLINKD